MRVTLPRFGGSQVTLERFEPPSGFDEVHSATRAHAFAFSVDKRSVRVIDR
ncbi:MAG: hypothetical protein IPJ65_22400 [Archangiaceae bacterium]|nr:hypothetical protein [Archangiaceae bacterium]